MSARDGVLHFAPDRDAGFCAAITRRADFADCVVTSDVRIVQSAVALILRAASVREHYMIQFDLANNPSVAAQHHGTPSRVATQSVVVHLLTLNGVIRRGLAAENAQWARRRALRNGDRFEWLEPPPTGAALSVRHLFPGDNVGTPCSVAAYVASVHASWDAVHGPRLEEWYDRFVLAD